MEGRAESYRLKWQRQKHYFLIFWYGAVKWRAFLLESIRGAGMESMPTCWPVYSV